MQTRRFPSRTEAEDFLKSEGFAFQGAPNRWRKQDGGRILYAEVLTVRDSAVVVTSHPSGEAEAASPEEQGCNQRMSLPCA